MRCLIDHAYKVNKTWASFHNDVTKIKETLKRNSFPLFLIDKITKSYLEKMHSIVITLIQNLTKYILTIFHKLEKIQSKFRKSCQKPVNSSAKMLILIVSLFLLKLITLYQLKKKPLFL